MEEGYFPRWSHAVRLRRHCPSIIRKAHLPFLPPLFIHAYLSRLLSSEHFQHSCLMEGVDHGEPFHEMSGFKRELGHFELRDENVRPPPLQLLSGRSGRVGGGTRLETGDMILHLVPFQQHKIASRPLITSRDRILSPFDDMRLHIVSF